MEKLEEILQFVQEMREEGETDLRQIIGFVQIKIKEAKDES